MDTACENRLPPFTVEIFMVEKVEMKRDDDLVRKLLLDMEASPNPDFLFAVTISMSPEDRKTLYHLRLLVDAGFLVESGRNGGVFRITNSGHDFLAAIRDEASWGKVKRASGALGQVGLGVMREIGVGYLRAKAKEMGIPID